MKYILQVLIILGLSGCSFGADKEAHFVTGAVISKVVYDLTDNKMLSCASSLGVGVIKEIWDEKRGGKMDYEDIAWTAGGCTLWQIDF